MATSKIKASATWAYKGTLSNDNPSLTINGNISEIMFIRTNSTRATYWESGVYPRQVIVFVLGSVQINRSNNTYTLDSGSSNYFVDVFVK